MAGREQNYYTRSSSKTLPVRYPISSLKKSAVNIISIFFYRIRMCGCFINTGTFAAQCKLIAIEIYGLGMI
jgi:hypothetical protein